MSSILIVYAIAINLLAFSLMGTDKANARQNKRRIPEAALFLSALAGGRLGNLLIWRTCAGRT